MSCVDKPVIRDILGVPFKIHGRDPQNGFDCWGLVVWLMKHDLNIDIPVDWQYDNLHNVTEIFTTEYRLAKEHKSSWVETNASDAHIVLISTGGIIEHIGYMCTETHFVHILENSVVRIDKINGLIWKNRIAGFYRWSK